jgi:putative endonuclease
VGKHDELDLLARDGTILVIIEVKTRTESGLRPPKDSVDRDKQWNLNRAAVAYARALDPKPDGLRFDIVEVVGRPRSDEVEIRHHPGAFGLHPSFRF